MTSPWGGKKVVNLESRIGLSRFTRFLKAPPFGDASGGDARLKFLAITKVTAVTEARNNVFLFVHAWVDGGAPE